MTRNRDADVARYGLNAVMEFDHVIQVHEDGTVTDAPNVRNAWAPELHGVELGRETLEGGWDLMTDGYTGQYGYRGPIMHNSEFIGGQLERDILATPGYYVALVCYWDDNECIHCGEDVTEGMVNDRAVLVDDSGAMYCNDDDSGPQHENDSPSAEGWAIAYRETI